MALITDILQTVLRVQGLNQYVQGMQQAAAASAQMAVAQNSMGAAVAAVGFQTAATAGKFSIWYTVLKQTQSILSEITGTMRELTKEFEKQNDALFKTVFVFQNMGKSLPAAYLRMAAREQAGRTGIPEENTLDLARRSRISGFSTRTTSNLVPLLQDLETAGLGDAQGNLDKLNRFIRGEATGSGGGSRILSALRIDPTRLTGGAEHDLQEIMRQLTVKVGGLSDLMAQTISGTFAREQTLLTMAMGRLGGVIAASLVPAVEFLNRSLLGFNRIVDTLSNPESTAGKYIRSFEAILPAILGPVGYFLQPFTRLQEQQRLANQRGEKSDRDKQQQSLDEIAENTRVAAHALFVAAFGSASAFTRGAASFRNLNAAFAARG